MGKMTSLLERVQVFTEMPEGWTVDEGATTAPAGYVWIWNKKPRFPRNGKPSERKSGLLKKS